MTNDFTVLDSAGGSWTLSDYLDSAVLITFHRGDF
jgi:peroxiredoxin